MCACGMIEGNGMQVALLNTFVAIAVAPGRWQRTYVCIVVAIQPCQPGRASCVSRWQCRFEESKGTWLGRVGHRSLPAMFCQRERVEEARGVACCVRTATRAPPLFLAGRWPLTAEPHGPSPLCRIAALSTILARRQRDGVTSLCEEVSAPPLCRDLVYKTLPKIS